MLLDHIVPTALAGSTMLTVLWTLTRTAYKYKPQNTPIIMNAEFAAFRNFLEEEGVQQKYDKNIKEFMGNDTNPEDFLSYLEEDTQPTYYVKGAFPWGNTTEGWDYWQKIDDAWKQKATLAGIIK